MSFWAFDGVITVVVIGIVRGSAMRWQMTAAFANQPSASAATWRCDDGPLPF